jgi:hypothetical protein
MISRYFVDVVRTRLQTHATSFLPAVSALKANAPFSRHVHVSTLRVPYRSSESLPRAGGAAFHREPTAVRCTVLAVMTLAGSMPVSVSVAATEPGWFACQADSDCVLVTASSCSAAASVNRKYAQAFRLYREDITRRAECAAPPLADAASSARREALRNRRAQCAAATRSSAASALRAMADSLRKRVSSARRLGRWSPPYRSDRESAHAHREGFTPGFG